MRRRADAHPAAHARLQRERTADENDRNYGLNGDIASLKTRPNSRYMRVARGERPSVIDVMDTKAAPVANAHSSPASGDRLHLVHATPTTESADINPPAKSSFDDEAELLLTLRWHALPAFLVWMALILVLAHAQKHSSAREVDTRLTDDDAKLWRGHGTAAGARAYTISPDV